MPSPRRVPTATAPAVLGRRVLLGASAGLVAVAAAGCSFDSLDPTSEDPTITPTSGPSADQDATSAGAGDPGDTPDGGDDAGAGDAALVADVLTSIALAHRTARATARAHRDLASVLRTVQTVHLAHADELGGLPEATGRVTRSGETAAQALARVEKVEGRLQQTLVEAATSAGSGALAQTFASMAAAVAQLRTTLTRSAGGDA